MIKLFCSHPAKTLHVNKDHTEQKIDDDFLNVTYHLYCLRCGKEIDISYAKMNGEMNKFFEEL